MYQTVKSADGIKAYGEMVPDTVFFTTTEASRWIKIFVSRRARTISSLATETDGGYFVLMFVSTHQESK
jgi:hypothetical protein